MEAVIAITEVPEAENPSCLRAHGAATKVLFFQDFSPRSIPQPSLKALTSFDWQSYGLTLRTHIVDGEGDVVLEWEELPPLTHIDIALHCYQRKVMMLQTQQRYPVDRNLVKKALKLALDNLKEKYPGILLSPHALKIQRYAPDLSKAIAGLILSSNDSEFQGECASLLGLHHLDISEEGKFESCIRDRINEIIVANDRKPKRGKDRGPCLFENHMVHEEDCHDDEAEYEGDIDLDG